MSRAPSPHKKPVSILHQWDTWYIFATRPKSEAQNRIRITISLTGFLCRGIEIDFILESGSKLTSFQWWGRNPLGFYVRDRNWLSFYLGHWNWLVFAGGSKSTSVFVCGPNWLVFSLWIEIDLVFSVGIEIVWVFVCRPNWLVFSVGIDWVNTCAGGWNWPVFCMLAENHLVLV